MTCHVNVKLTSRSLSSGKLFSSILGGSSCLSAIEFRAVFRFSVMTVKNVTIVCHSCYIENCNSNSDNLSERKLDNTKAG